MHVSIYPIIHNNTDNTDIIDSTFYHAVDNANV